jgi:general secretion pathway protein J
LQTAWNQAARWGQNPSDADRQLEVRITPLLGWQIFFYRGGAWTNPLSSAEAATVSASPQNLASAAGASPNVGNIFGGNPQATTPTAVNAMPDGVRLMLTLPADQAVSGLLTRDWARTGLGGPQ